MVDELEHLRREYDVDVILLSDEYPTPDAQRWERFLDLVIERDLGQKLLLETRVGDVVRDEPILDKYVAAGVAHVYVGIEATDQETLDLINKDANVESGIQALRLLLPARNRQRDVLRARIPGRDAREDQAHPGALEGPTIPTTPTTSPSLRGPTPSSGTRWSRTSPRHDYRKYNLIDPVIRPKAMSLEDVDNAIVDCYRSFYTHKAVSVLHRQGFGAPRLHAPRHEAHHGEFLRPQEDDVGQGQGLRRSELCSRRSAWSGSRRRP